MLPVASYCHVASVSGSLRQLEWGPAGQTSGQHGTAVLVVFKLYVLAQEQMAARLFVLEQPLSFDDGPAQLGFDGEGWSPSGVSSSAHELEGPVALLASPVSPVCFIGGCMIEFFDPICRSAASCFA